MLRSRAGCRHWTFLDRTARSSAPSSEGRRFRGAGPRIRRFAEQSDETKVGDRCDLCGELAREGRLREALCAAAPRPLREKRDELTRGCKRRRWRSMPEEENSAAKGSSSLPTATLAMTLDAHRRR